MTQELETSSNQVRAVYNSFYMAAEVVKRLLGAGIAFGVTTQSTPDTTEWTITTGLDALPTIHSYKE